MSVRDVLRGVVFPVIFSAACFLFVLITGGGVELGARAFVASLAGGLSSSGFRAVRRSRAGRKARADTMA